MNDLDVNDLDVGAVERNLTAYYDQEAAERAERAIDPARVALRDDFLSRLDGRHRVLEVGTGPGRDAAAFVDAGRPVVGLDLSLEHAVRARAAGVQALVATARALPFPDGAFTALWTMSTLMHVPDSAIARTLAELRRVLAPGAPVAVGVWGGPDVQELYDDGSDRPPRLFSRRSNERWRSLLAALGTLERFTAWDHRGLAYQFALLRTPPNP